MNLLSQLPFVLAELPVNASSYFVIRHAVNRSSVVTLVGTSEISVLKRQIIK